MIYFIEHDEAGNIVHACADPMATIVPLVNRVIFNDSSGNPLRDTDGGELSPYGSKLLEPTGVEAEVYETITSGGLENYLCDPITLAVTKKAVSPSLA